MADHDRPETERPSEMLETRLGPVGAGLPPIPEPATWDSAYGIDEAVAVAVVPERALIFWELAGIIEAGIDGDEEFHLVRLRLEGEIPKRESWWKIEPLGRFQDGGVQPGCEYLYVISRLVDGEEIPLLVTNPIRMPVRRAPSEIPGDLPWSIDLYRNKRGPAVIRRKDGQETKEDG